MLEEQRNPINCMLILNWSRANVASTRRSRSSLNCSCVMVSPQSQQSAAVSDGLRRIGIDELSYRRRHQYITVVVDPRPGGPRFTASG